MFWKEDLQNMFEEFASRNPDKKDYVEKSIEQLYKFDNNFAFDRKCFDNWHFTGSVLVVNEEGDKVLLMHHKKRWTWQHFWWHADWEIDLLSVAKRELEEEAWIPIDKSFISEEILNLDAHIMEAHKWEPEHIHYDVCFKAIVSDKLDLVRQEEEVNEIKWFDIDDLPEWVSDWFEKHFARLSN